MFLEYIRFPGTGLPVVLPHIVCRVCRTVPAGALLANGPDVNSTDSANRSVIHRTTNSVASDDQSHHSCHVALVLRCRDCEVRIPDARGLALLAQHLGIVYYWLS